MSVFSNLRGVLSTAFSLGKTDKIEIENSSGDFVLKTAGSERARLNSSGVTVTGDSDLSAGSVYKINGTQLDGGDVGLGNVTNDAQLKRAAGDINTFTEKGTPVAADLLLVEDSADSNNKKKVQIDNLPASGSKPIVQTLKVGQAGSDVDYNSIKDAVDAAVAGGASGSAPWRIDVYPGAYVEDPMTVPLGVNIISTDQRVDTVFVVASDPTNDLFTLAGGYICGLNMSGVTSTGKALVTASTAGSLNVLHGVSFNNCYYGIHVSGGATMICTNVSCLIASAGVSVDTGIRVTGTSSFLLMSGCFFSVPSAVLPAYASNPIETAVCIEDAADAFILGGVFQVSPKNSDANAILVDSAATCFVSSGVFAGCGNAIHIGSSGSNTSVVSQGSSFKDNSLNTLIDSSTGTIFCNETVDLVQDSLVSGAKKLGVAQIRDDERVDLLGDVQYKFVETDRRAGLGVFFNEMGASGVSSGGIVSINSGLDVDVSAGTGWVRRRSTYNDLASVVWNDVIALTLTASNTNYVYYNETSGAVTASVTPPGYSDSILLATVVTDGSGVRYIHQTRNYVDSPAEQLRDYLLATRKIALNSGLAVDAGTTSLKFDVTVGSYYLGLDLISFAGAADATFSYFYGTNGANEVSSQTEIDDEYYDNAGTLTLLTAGYFKADTVVLTSDGRISVIYGTEEFATQEEAESAAVANTPTFIEHSAIQLANIVVEDGAGIASFVDIRPQPGAITGGGGAAGVSNHGLLSGLADDDHVQYLLSSGSRAMSGSLDMGGNNITNVANVDGVDVSSHASRHDPGGADSLTTGTPVTTLVDGAAAEGSAASYARSDHQHGIASGVPSSVGTSNSAGSASTVAASDHVHDHGAQTDGTLHAAATTGVNGFMSAADKTKLDNATATPTADRLVIADGFGTVDDWITSGDLTEAVSSVLTINNGSGAVLGSGTSIQIAQAGAGQSGYLTSVDWNTFNDKIDGGVNVGALGVGVFKQKNGTDLEFLNINSGSNKITVVADLSNDEIDIDVDESNVVHQNLSGAGTNDHSAIDAHIGNSNIHFTESSIDHTNISNIGANTHAQIDTHIADSTIHFTEGNIDHTAIQNIGTNSHVQIDAHIASTTNPHSVDKTDVSLGNVTNDSQLKRAANDFTTFTEKTSLADDDVILIEDSADTYSKKRLKAVNLPSGSGGGGPSTPGTTTDNAIVRWDGTDGSAIQNSGTTVDDNDVITLNSDGGAVKVSTPASDLNANGIIISGTVDTNATGVGALLFLNTDGNWDEAQANSATTVGQLGLAMESGTGTKKILLYGIFRKDAWGWSVGHQNGALYVSGATAGAMTQTAPSTDGYQIQKCGYAISADAIMFAPSPDIAEYVA